MKNQNNTASESKPIEYARKIIELACNTIIIKYRFFDSVIAGFTIEYDEELNGYIFSNNKLTVGAKRLLTDYMDYNSGETPVLHKMKEIWAYMEDLFPENAAVKKIFRADRISGYRAAVREVFRGK